MHGYGGHGDAFARGEVTVSVTDTVVELTFEQRTNITIVHVVYSTHAHNISVT